MMDRSEKLLIKAYNNLDIKKLRDAISLGVDINAFDPDGFPYWYSHLLNKYSLYDEEGKFLSENQSFWEKDRNQIMEILKYSVSNGLNINVKNNSNGGVFYPAISFLAFGPYDFRFVDFLISIGFDPVSKNGGACQFDVLIHYLETAIAEKQLSKAQGVWELGKYLQGKFSILKESYNVLKYSDSFIF